MKRKLLSFFMILFIFLIPYTIIENLFFNKYSLDTFVAIIEILFNGFIGLFLGNYYFKKVSKKKYNPIKTVLRIAGCFVLSCFYTYVVCGIVTIGVFEFVNIFNPHLITSKNQEWNVSVYLLMGWLSTVSHIILVYIITKKSQHCVKANGEEEIECVENQ